jgi:hypothetical protein
MLIRPDAYLAWVSSGNDAEWLEHALRRWFIASPG